MSDRRSNKHSYSPPNPRTYIRIVEAGCKGWYDAYLGEHDCIYRWPCEECPVYAETPEGKSEEEPKFILLA